MNASPSSPNAFFAGHGGSKDSFLPSEPKSLHSFDSSQQPFAPSSFFAAQEISHIANHSFAAPPPPLVDEPATLPYRPAQAPIVEPPPSSNSTPISNASLHYRNSIAFIGDNSLNVPQDIVALSEALLMDLQNNESIVLDAFIQSIGALSVKTGIYATVVGIMNKSNSAFVKNLVQKVVFNLEIDFARGNYNEALLLLRFLVGLMCANAIKPHTVFSLLEDLMNMQNASELRSSQYAVDYPIFIACLCLPWISVPVYEQYKEAVNGLIDRATAYMATRNAEWMLPVAYVKENSGGEEDSVIKDRLERTVEALNNMKQANWSSKTTFRFYQSTALMPMLQVADAQELHDLPNITIKASDFAILAKPIGSIMMLNSCMDSDIAHFALHDRRILEEHTLSILHAFNASVSFCAKSLVMIQVDHPQFEYVIIESIMSQILFLPKYPSTDVSYDCILFYFRVIYTLTELNSGFKVALERYIHAFIRNATKFDEECFEVIVEFFAYWLSVTHFEWNYAYVLDSLKKEGVERFVRRSMERLSRLVDRSTLILQLPEGLHSFVPETELGCVWLTGRESPPREFTLLETMMQSNVVGEDIERITTKICYFIYELIGKKHLSSLPTRGTESSLEQPEKKRIKVTDSGSIEGGGLTEGANNHSSTDIPIGEDESLLSYEYDEASEMWTYEQAIQLFLLALLSKGHKSLTHMNRMLENYGSLIKAFSPSCLLDNKADLSVYPFLEVIDSTNDSTYYGIIIRSIFQFWCNHSIRITATLKSLVDLNLLPYTSVFRFIIFDITEEDQDKTHNWEVLHQIIENALLVKSLHEANYTIAHRRDIRDPEELEECQHNIDDAATAIQQMVLFLCASLMVKHEIIEATNAVFRNLALNRVLCYGRRYAKHLDLEDCIDKVTTPELSEELKEVVTKLKLFEKYYCTDASCGL